MTSGLSLHYDPITCTAVERRQTDTGEYSYSHAIYPGRPSNVSYGTSIPVQYETTELFICRSVHGLGEAELIVAHRASTSAPPLYACFPIVFSGTQGTHSSVEKMMTNTRDYNKEWVQDEPMVLGLEAYAVPDPKVTTQTNVVGETCTVLLFRTPIVVSTATPRPRGLPRTLWWMQREGSCSGTSTNAVAGTGIHGPQVSLQEGLTNNESYMECEYLPEGDSADQQLVYQIGLNSDGVAADVQNRANSTILICILYLILFLLIYFVCPIVYFAVLNLLVRSNRSFVWLKRPIPFIKNNLKYDVSHYAGIVSGLIWSFIMMFFIIGLAVSLVFESVAIFMMVFWVVAAIGVFNSSSNKGVEMADAVAAMPSLAPIAHAAPIR